MAQKHSKPGPIPETEGAVFDEKTLRFSFKHLDTRNPKFEPSRCGTDYFCRLFLTLQRFSTWTVGQFIDQTNKEHRHIIDFAATSEPDGFQDVSQIDRDQAGYAEGWQFSAYPEVPWSNWRVHGILIDDTFYVVWLDPDHRLYPKRLALNA